MSFPVHTSVVASAVIFYFYTTYCRAFDKFMFDQHVYPSHCGWKTTISYCNLTTTKRRMFGCYTALTPSNWDNYFSLFFSQCLWNAVRASSPIHNSSYISMYTWPNGRSGTHISEVAGGIRPITTKGYSRTAHCCVRSHLSLFMINRMDLDPASLRRVSLKIIVGQTCNVIVPLAWLDSSQLRLLLERVVSNLLWSSRECLRFFSRITVGDA